MPETPNPPPRAPRKARKRKLLSVRVPEELVDELDELAGEKKTTRSDVTRDLLEMGILLETEGEEPCKS